MGLNSSYIWQSIIWSRYVITKDLIWLLGDVRNIYVSKYAWITRLSSIRSSVINNNSIDVKVAHLISPKWLLEWRNSKQLFSFFWGWQNSKYLYLSLKIEMIQDSGYETTRVNTQYIQNIKWKWDFFFFFFYPQPIRMSHPLSSWCNMFWKLKNPS